MSASLINLMSRQNYAHGLNWCGVPIFQTPTDLYLYQEIINKIKPKVIIETGVAKGGSVLFACHILDLIHRYEKNPYWKVICCDINSIETAKNFVEKHGYSDNVEFFQGDSTSPEFKTFVKKIIENMDNPGILLSLDSNHTEDHVYLELNSLAEFVSEGSYAIVWDSRIGDLSSITHLVRPRAWNKSHHAGTGSIRFMKEKSSQFNLDTSFEDRLRITGVKKGILQRVVS